MSLVGPQEIGPHPAAPAVAGQGGAWAACKLRSMAVFFIQPVILGCMLVRIPDIKHDLALDNTELALGLVGMSLGTLFTLPLAGRLFARIGARQGLLFGLPAFISAMVLVGFMPDLPTLFLALMLAGSMMAFTELGMNLKATHVEREADGSMMNRAHGCWSVGIMVGSLAGVGLAGLGASLGVASAVLALVLVPAGLALAYPLPRVDPPAHAGPATRPANFFRPPLVLVGIACYMFGTTFVEGAISDWSAIHVRELLGDPEAAAAGFGFSLFAAMLAVGRFAGDWLKLRLGAVLLARLLGVASLSGTVLLVAWPSVPVAFVSFALMGIGASVAFPLGISAAGRLPGQTSVHLSFLTFSALFGFLVGPPAIGFLADTFSLRVGFGLVLLPLLLLSLACTGALRAGTAAAD